MLALHILRHDWRTLFLIVSLIVAGLSVPMCREKGMEANQAFHNLQTVQDSARVVHLVDSSTITSQRQLLVASKAQITALTAKVSELENVTAHVRYRTRVVAPPAAAPIERPVYVVDSIDHSRYLRVPAKFRLQNKWYTHSGSVQGNGTIQLDTMVVWLETSVTFGDEKHKWYQLFKPWQPTVSVHEKNPYAIVSNVQNVVLQQRPPRLSAGLQAGYGILPVQRTVGPYVGLGIQWQILGSRK